MNTIGIVLLLLSIIAISRGDRYCRNPAPFYNRYLNNFRLSNRCPQGNTAQCVSAVFNLCGAPDPYRWRKNKRVTANCHNIKRNTAIASFYRNGGTQYDRSGVNGHAAIFLYCLPWGDIRVADQWCGRPMNEHTLPKRCFSNRPYSNCADYFYTFDW